MRGEAASFFSQFGVAQCQAVPAASAVPASWRSVSEHRTIDALVSPAGELVTISRTQHRVVTRNGNGVTEMWMPARDSSNFRSAGVAGHL